VKQHAPGVDLAPYNAAQPHYIAGPVIEGGHDPIPRRTGWRKGADEAVILPPLRTEPLRKSKPANSSSPSGTVEDALALLGDGDGLSGFHVPLRTAAMRYARRCTRYGERDDDAFVAMLKAAIRAAPRRSDRNDVNEYLATAYLRRLIDGAFDRLAADPDIQTMQPHHTAPEQSIEAAREALSGAAGLHSEQPV
jgi:hypothetical protein